jgi:hypothetical protein
VLPAEAGTRALLVAAGPRISGSAVDSIVVLIAVPVAALKGRPPALEPEPIEWSVLDPGEDLAPGSRQIGSVEGVYAEPSDEGSGPAGLETCEL